MREESCLNRVFYKNAQAMDEVPDDAVDLIVTSPPYFNVKDYTLDGYQLTSHSAKDGHQLGDLDDYGLFIKELLKVWRECERVLRPKGKLVINTSLMPMRKADYSTHYNRHIFDLNSDIQQSILHQPGTEMYLYDVFIWERANPSKKLMFGSYPYPRNFYAQNTSEFITVYVKDGKPENNVPRSQREASKLTQDEWVEYTKQVWRIAIPGREDLAFGEHSALMPEEIVYRCLRLFTFVGDVVLDPFAGSGTTLKVALENGRQYIGYEIMASYKRVIERKLHAARQRRMRFPNEV